MSLPDAASDLGPLWSLSGAGSQNPVSRAQRGATSGDEAVFYSLVFIRRISSVYVNLLPYISGSLRGGERENEHPADSLASCQHLTPFPVISTETVVLCVRAKDGSSYA